jgi:hypothetical protein
MEGTRCERMSVPLEDAQNSDERLTPTGRDLVWIVLVGLLLHVAVFVLASAWFHIPLGKYVFKGDGESYIAYARALCGQVQQLDQYDRRVFPGYPAMIALVHSAGAPVQWAGLGITWFSAAVAAALAAALFQDRRMGWGLLILPPHYLINSSLVMTEAPFLALVLGGLLLARRGHTVAGGAMLGAAGLVRPMACFAVLGAMAMRFRFGRWRQSLLLGGVAAIVVAAGIVALHLWTGDALEGTRVYANYPRAYGGRLLMWPFEALIETPQGEPTSVGKMVYIWAHVLVVLAGCAILTRWAWKGIAAASSRRNGAEMGFATLACVWLVGNTIFVLCIGSPWGFRHFPRFTIPAMPALLWALRPVLPLRWWMWLPLIAGVFVMGVLGVQDAP